jgi:hypothetical protein
MHPQSPVEIVAGSALSAARVSGSRPVSVARALPGAERWSKTQTRLLLAIVLIGMASRVLYVDRPLDHRLLAPWREADYTQLARNFYRDSLNILYPTIDWRGDTPGYAEMEFPVIPWVGGVAYRVFGYNESLLRVPAALLGVLSMLVFAGLARRVLSPDGTLFAVAAFALNPVLIVLGNAMQPDPLMVFLSLSAMALIWRWQDDPTFPKLLGAAAVTAAAILAKSPAAFLGLVLAYTVVRVNGVRALTDIRTYIAALVALLPPLAWYLWAWHFWHVYGNSLGVSNETHFIGLDMLNPPRFLYGLLKWETLVVLSPAGWLLALAALRRPLRVERALVWWVAVWAFYLLTARTSADDWSFYYHCIGVAPACLLMGAGAAALSRGDVLPPGFRLSEWQRPIGRVLGAGALLGLAAVAALLIYRRDHADYNHYVEMRRCALEFVPQVPADQSIVVFGGWLNDEYGTPVAHNESMLFGWMDRKGFNYATENLSIPTLDAIASRGGRWWIVARPELEEHRMVDQVNARYRRVAACDDRYYLYDLQSGAAAS